MIIGRQNSLRLTTFCRWRHNRAQKNKLPRFFHLQDEESRLKVIQNIADDCSHSKLLIHFTESALSTPKCSSYADQWRASCESTTVSLQTLNKKRGSKELCEWIHSNPSDAPEKNAIAILCPFSYGRRLTPILFALTEAQYRAPFYSIVTEQEMKLIANNEMLRIPPSKPNQAIFYRYLLNSKLLQQLPLSSFNGPNTMSYEYYENSGKKIIGSSESLFLIRLNPKESLPIDLTELKRFYKFFHAVFNRTKARLIPAIESLCPGIGLTLIENGFNMQQSLLDVDVQQWLHVYQLTVGSREYGQSVIHEIIEP